MKMKIFAISVLMILIASSIIIVNADKPAIKGNGIDLTGFHYNLNIIGKKDNWNGNAGIDQDSSRHTMFIPEDTTTVNFIAPDGEVIEESVAIWFTQNTDGDFAVIDGNAFDDGWCHFELAPGTYRVFITCKAKPGFNTDIYGWVYAEDEYGTWYHLDVGEIHVTKAKKWKECTDIFYVSTQEDDFGIISEDTWVFTYMKDLIDYDFGDDPDITNALYFWQIMNNGNKLIKLRFYPDE